MTQNIIEILDGGLLTTIQDTGRYGFQKFGIPVSGAMDIQSLKYANKLLDNPLNAACLEITIIGPKIEFLDDTFISITGANISPKLNDKPAEMWQSIKIKKGDILEFKELLDGMRAYIAFAGGIDVEKVMDSRSTYLQGSFGGFKGKKLDTGDIIKSFNKNNPNDMHLRKYPHLEYGHEHEINIILGPQNDYFPAESISTLLNSEYKISLESDRMGYRLDGPPITHIDSPDIISDGTANGSIQIPGDGIPIILLADRGTTGGYTKIATVISSDLPKLGQALPGDILKFKVITIEEATKFIKSQDQALESYQEFANKSENKIFNIDIDGEFIEINDNIENLYTSTDKLPPPIITKSIKAQTILPKSELKFDFEIEISRKELIDEN